MTYRVTYTREAESGLSGLPARRRRQVTGEIERTLGRDPYGHGSSPVRGNEDRRDATVSGVIVCYEVSGAVLVVTVLRTIAF